MGLKLIIKGIAQSYLRKRTPVVLGDLKQREPIDPSMGWNRGTPIDRHYIESFLGKNAKYIRAKVLEVAERSYTEKFGAQAVAEAWLLQYQAQNMSTDVAQKILYADLTSIKTDIAEPFDCFICSQTFNFIYDVKAAIEGANRLLKPGGTLLATVSGLSQISRYDMDRWGDYWRFTELSIKKLFEQHFSGEIVLESYGNMTAALGFLQGACIEDLPSLDILNQKHPDYQMVIGIRATKISG